jgi:hypothetical protein
MRGLTPPQSRARGRHGYGPRGIVNFSGRAMLVVSVVRQLGQIFFSFIYKSKNCRT